MDRYLIIHFPLFICPKMVGILLIKKGNENIARATSFNVKQN